MARIYLLNPPFIPHFGRSARWQDTGRGGTLYYPIWLAYATGLLEKEGHEVKLVDAPARGYSLPYVIQDIMRFCPDIVVVDTSFTSLKNDLKVAREIKSRVPDAFVIGVGPPTSQFPEYMINNGFDAVARYEYDWTLAELANNIEEGRDLTNVLGISYKANGRILHNPKRPFSTNEQLDQLPFVSQVYARHLNIHDYFLSSSLYPEVQIFASRGCPYKCTFCCWPQTFMGRVNRRRSVTNVLEELIWIKENLRQVKEVVFEDDTFGIDKKWLRNLCKEIIKRKLNITWNCQIRADVDFETLKLMAKAGCRLVIVGFESANQQILNNIRKGITVEQMRKFAENVKKAGILLHADFIIGLPGETKETIKQTFQFIKEIKPDILQVSVVAPFPGTELYEWYKNNGYLTTDNPEEYLDTQGHQKSVVSFPWLTAEEITKAVDEILKGYYISPIYPIIVLRQIFRKKFIDEAKRIYRSALTFINYIRAR